jgi:predicted RNA binding protein YcfA (HicA-like mRNA interferase family)
MPSEVRFAEVRKLLEKNGYVMTRISRSHHIFEAPSGGHVSVPVHGGKVKPIYVKKIRKALEG